MVKGTYLYREFMLRLDVRRLTQQYYDLKEQGLHTWAAYDEHKKSIKASFAAIRRSLKRYKDRRIKAGFFYMCTHSTLNLLYVMSPMYTMPQKEALKKIRRILRNRVLCTSKQRKTSWYIKIINLVEV